MTQLFFYLSVCHPEQNWGLILREGKENGYLVDSKQYLLQKSKYFAQPHKGSKDQP